MVDVVTAIPFEYVPGCNKLGSLRIGGCLFTRHFRYLKCRYSYAVCMDVRLM